MANGDAITTKFKVDISDLKRGISEANKNIKLANAQFKEASSGMQNWSKSADGIRAKLNQLQSVLGSQVSKLSNYEKELERVEDASRENGKRAEELKAKLQQLASQGVSETSAEYKKYQKALTEVEKEQLANENAADALKVTILNQQAAVNRTKSDIDKWSTSLESVKAEQRQAESATGQLNSTIEEQQNELDKLKQKYKDVVLEQGKNSNSARDLANQIDNLSSDLQENQRRLNEVDSAANDLDHSLDQSSDSAEDAGEGFTIFKGALADLVAEGIRKTIDALGELVTDSANAYAQFAANTGTATEAMDEYEEAIKNVYKNNFGESLEDVANAMARVKEVTGEIDPSKLEDMTEKAITLEDVFGMDMTETLRGVQSLMDHFGLTSEEAFDYLASGAQNGLNYTDELGDNISEYAGKFAEAGYSTDEYFQLLQNGSDGGAYNLDKVNDAINEVTARLADGTIGDSLSMFSTDTQDLFKSWQDGGATQKEVIDSIVKDIQNTKGEQDKMNKAAKAFGTMAEDGGTKFIESLTSVGDTYTDVTGKAQELEDVKYDTPISALQSVGRTIRTDVLQPLSDSLMPAFQTFADWMEENLPAIVEKFKSLGSAVSALTPLFAGLGTALAGLALLGVVQNIAAIGAAMKAWAMGTKLVTAAQWLLNVAMDANPISLIVIAIAGLVAAFVLLWKKSDSFRNFWINLWESIKSTASSVGSAIVSAFDTVVNFFTVTIPSLLNTVLEFIKGNWQGLLLLLVNPFAGAFKLLYDNFEGFRTIVDNFLTTLKTSVSTAIDAVINFFTELPNKIAFALGYAIGTVAKFGVNLFNWAKTEVPKFINKVITFFKQLPSKIWNTLLSAYNKVKTWGKNVLDFVKTAIPKVITAVVNFYKELPSKIWGALLSAYNKVKNWASNVLHYVKTTIPKVISSVVNFFKELPSKMWTQLSKAIDKVKKWGSDLATKGKEAAKKLVTAVVNGIKEIPSKLKSIGLDIVKGLWNGISGAGGWLAGKIKGFASNVIKGFKKGFDSHSPSRRMRDEVGIHVATGLAAGIDKGAYTVLQAIKRLANGAVSYARSTFENSGFDEVAQSVVSGANVSIDDFLNKATVDIKSLVNGEIEAYSKAVDKDIKAINKTVDKQVKKINANKKLSKAQKNSRIAKIKDGAKAEIAELKNSKTNYQKAGKASITAYTDALKNFASEAKSAVSEAMSEVNDAFNEKYKALVDSQKALNDKMFGFGTLYTLNDNGTMTINNLKEQTAAITKYANDLNKIKSRISSDLFEAIADMSVEDGQKYMNKLFAMSDDELNQYNALYTKKLEAARNLSENIYKSDLMNLNREYNNAVDKALSGLSEKLNDLGANAMLGFIEGMTSQEAEMTSEIKKIANSIVDKFKKELKIKSPSRVFAKEVGKFIPSGIGLGIENNAKSLVKSVKRVTRQAVGMSQELLSGMRSPSLVMAGAGGGVGTTVVNNYTQTINAPKQPSRIELYRQTKNLLSLKGGV